jgi:hypothetical protein
MASSAYPIAGHDAVREESGDLFDSAAVWLVIVLMVLATLGTAAGLAVIYFGDSVAAPAWDERSVPAPRTS